jgi:hypothetical protein
MRLLALIAFFSFLHVVPAPAQTADGKSLDEVNKELSNPISSIWALQLQENTYWLNKPRARCCKPPVSTGAPARLDRRLEFDHPAAGL